MNGKIVRKQKCVKLAEYGDRYRCPSDLDDLVAEKMAGVRHASKCPHSSDLFVSYVEEVYLPMVQRTMSASTHGGYKAYWDRYLKPRVGKYALRDFTVAIVSGLLEDIANKHALNTDPVGKVRSLLERAAVALVAFTGVRPSEARGLRWEEWNREQQHIAVQRGVWHRIVGDTKTLQSVRFVTVTTELREILLDLWKAQGAPLGGYILAGRKGQPIILDNVSKRNIRPTLKEAGVTWHGFYSLRRFHATQVRMESKSSETAAKALGNTKDVCDKHYIKPETVLPDVRKAVNDAFSGLVH